MNPVTFFPFGKYKGRLLDEVIHLPDPGYWAWVLTQPFLWKHYPATLDAIWLAQGPHIFAAAVFKAKRRAGQ